MSVLIDRVVGLFVAPPAGAAAARHSRTRAQPLSACLICARADAFVLGAALSLLLGRGASGCPVLCVWTGRDEPSRQPGAMGLPAARRLAARLRAQGLEASPRGRVVTISLPADPQAAVVAADRAAGRAPAAMVVVLAGRRGPAVDAIAARQDVAAMALRPDSEPLLARLARLSLERAVPGVVECRAPARGPWEQLAAAGIATTPALRRALAPLVRGIR